MFEDFERYLKQLKRAFDINIWTDHKIHAGAEWEKEIGAAIDAANLFLLLVSPDFIGSDYVYEREIPAIRGRRRTGGVLVLPVILKRCTWQMIAAALQAVPTGRNHAVRPISDWKPYDNGYHRATEEIITAISRYFGLTPKAVTW
jgi:TIR domain